MISRVYGAEKPKAELAYEGELFLAYAKEPVASQGNIPFVWKALSSDGSPLSRVVLSCYEEAGVTPNMRLTTSCPQMFPALYYFQGAAAFFAKGMTLSGRLRNRPAG